MHHKEEVVPVYTGVMCTIKERWSLYRGHVHYKGEVVHLRRLYAS